MLPFAPVRSATEKKIRSLRPGASYVFSYNILTYPEAESKVYRIPIQLKYRDEANNEYSRTDMIGVIVGKEPDLSIWLESTDIKTSGDTGEVVIRLVNKDVTDIKFLKVTLDEDKDYTIKTSSEIYIGNIDSDDYETAEFDIYVDPKASKKITLPLTVQYKDSNNNEYTNITNLEIKLLSDEELKAQSNGKSNLFLGILIVVVVVIIGFIIYRRRKK